MVDIVLPRKNPALPVPLRTPLPAEARICGCHPRGLGALRASTLLLGPALGLQGAAGIIESHRASIIFSAAIGISWCRSNPCTWFARSQLAQSPRAMPFTMESFRRIELGLAGSGHSPSADNDSVWVVHTIFCEFRRDHSTIRRHPSAIESVLRPCPPEWVVHLVDLLDSPNPHAKL